MFGSLIEVHVGSTLSTRRTTPSVEYTQEHRWQACRLFGIVISEDNYIHQHGRILGENLGTHQMVCAGVTTALSVASHLPLRVPGPVATDLASAKKVNRNWLACRFRFKCLYVTCMK